MSGNFEVLPVGTAARLAELEKEVERLRLQLAACGVVAMANTPESAAKAREMHDDYRSASCEDVARAVDREMEARAEVERLRVDAERYRWLRDAHPLDGKLWIAMGVPHSPAGISCWRHEQADAAIDAAIKEASDE